MDFVEKYKQIKLKYDNLIREFAVMEVDKKKCNNSYLENVQKIKSKINEEEETYNLELMQIEKEEKDKLYAIEQENKIQATHLLDLELNSVKEEIEEIENNNTFFQNLSSSFNSYINTSFKKASAKKIIKDIYQYEAPLTAEQIVADMQPLKNRSAFEKKYNQLLDLSFSELDKLFRDGQYKKIGNNSNFNLYLRKKNIQVPDEIYFNKIMTMTLFSVSWAIFFYLFSISFGVIVSNVFSAITSISIDSSINILSIIIGYSPLVATILGWLVYFIIKYTDWNINIPMTDNIDSDLLNSNNVLYYLFASLDEKLVNKLIDEKINKMRKLSISQNDIDNFLSMNPHFNLEILVPVYNQLAKQGNIIEQYNFFDLECQKIIDNNNYKIEKLNQKNNQLFKDRKLIKEKKYNLLSISFVEMTVDSIRKEYQNVREIASQKFQLKKEVLQEKVNEIEILTKKQVEEIEREEENNRQLQSICLKEVDELYYELKNATRDKSRKQVKLEPNLLFGIEKSNNGVFPEWNLINHDSKGLYIFHESFGIGVDEISILSTMISTIIQGLFAVNTHNIFQVVYVEPKEKPGFGIRILGGRDELRQLRELDLFKVITTREDYFSHINKDDSFIIDRDNQEMLKEMEQLGIVEQYKPTRYELPIFEINSSLANNSELTRILNLSENLGIIPIFLIDYKEKESLSKYSNAFWEKVQIASNQNRCYELVMDEKTGMQTFRSLIIEKENKIMVMKFDARDFETIKEHVGNFTQAVNQSGEDVLSTIEEFFNEGYYEQVKIQTDKFIETFNNNFKMNIQSWLENWQNGPDSLVRLAEKIKSGESTIEEARNQQQDLIEQFEKINLRNDIEVLNVIDHFDTDRILDLGNEIKNKVSSAEQELAQTEERIIDIIDENQFYMGVKHIINPARSVYIRIFESFGESIITLGQKAEETASSEKARSENQIEETAAELRSRTTELSDELVDEMLNLFDVNNL